MCYIMHRVKTEMNKENLSLYDSVFVSKMFDRMSITYGTANYISSFGFTSKWRKKCINKIPTSQENVVVYDLMSGMGESWKHLQRKINNNSKIVAIDVSDEMNKKASIHREKLSNKNIELKKANILSNDIPNSSADFIVSTFGIKTFNKAQQQKLALEINRILKPGGMFSFIEISEPNLKVTRIFYMFYLKNIVPLIGKFFMNNSEDYKMLGEYCSKFKNSSYFHFCLNESGLKSTYKSYFWGCASGVHGVKEF